MRMGDRTGHFDLTFRTGLSLSGSWIMAQAARLRTAFRVSY